MELTDIEKAIKWITRGSWKQDVETARSLATIMEALLEKAEREK